MDFTSHANTPECKKERQTVEEMMKIRCKLVQTAINKGIDQKNDILQEVGSTRSGSSHVSCISSMSSTTIQAQVRAEAVAAIKKKKWPKPRPSRPSC